MFKKEYRPTNCRQQDFNPVGFFCNDITVQKFEIKSQGKVIKTFMGKVFVPMEVSQ